MNNMGFDFFQSATSGAASAIPSNLAEQIKNIPEQNTNWKLLAGYFVVLGVGFYYLKKYSKKAV